MRRVPGPLWLLLPALLLGGCISAPPSISYIQLSADNAPPGASPTPRVLVDAISVPDFLLRNELLRRIDDNQLRYDSSVRWAEPLDVGVQRVLARRLSAALDSASVVSFPAAQRSDIDWRVGVSLRNFEASGDELVITADLRLFPRGDGEPHVERFASSMPLRDSSAPAIAAGLSDLLAKLVEEIVRQMERHAAAAPPSAR